MRVGIRNNGTLGKWGFCNATKGRGGGNREICIGSGINDGVRWNGLMCKTSKYGIDSGKPTVGADVVAII